MRNQRLQAKGMRNQCFQIYIQMSTVIHKFLLHIFSNFQVFPNLQFHIFKKIKNDFLLIFKNLNQVSNYFWHMRYQRHNETLQQTSSIVANPQLSTLQLTIFFGTDEKAFKLSQQNLYVVDTSLQRTSFLCSKSHYSLEHPITDPIRKIYTFYFRHCFTVSFKFSSIFVISSLASLMIFSGP